MSGYEEVNKPQSKSSDKKVAILKRRDGKVAAFWVKGDYPLKMKVNKIIFIRTDKYRDSDVRKSGYSKARIYQQEGMIKTL